MNAVRHYIFVLIGLIALYFFIGLAATLWVGGLFLLCFGIYRMSSIVQSLRSILVCYWMSAILAIGSSVFLFIRDGWIAALGFIVLILGAATLREGQHSKWERRVKKLRTSLRENITQRTTRKVMQGQLEERCFLILRRDLFEEAYSLSFLYEPLLSKEGLSDSEYQSYLKVFEKYLADVDFQLPISNLHAEVRMRLGLPTYRIDDFRKKLAELKERGLLST